MKPNLGACTLQLPPDSPSTSIVTLSASNPTSLPLVATFPLSSGVISTSCPISNHPFNPALTKSGSAPSTLVSLSTGAHPQISFAASSAEIRGGFPPEGATSLVAAMEAVTSFIQDLRRWKCELAKRESAVPNWETQEKMK